MTTILGQGERHRMLREAAPPKLFGGPTPEGHRHVAETRNPDRPGGRTTERAWEAAVWAPGCTALRSSDEAMI